MSYKKILTTIAVLFSLSTVLFAQQPQHLKVFGISMGETKDSFSTKLSTADKTLIGKECKVYVNPYEYDKECSIVWHIEVCTPESYLDFATIHGVRAMLFSKYGKPTTSVEEPTSSSSFIYFYDWVLSSGRITLECISKQGDCHIVLNMYDKENVKKRFAKDISKL